jgi:hypothetical protein
MKNIHVLPTHKPSRLHFDGKLFLYPNYQNSKTIYSIVEGRNIYITSDEEAEEGDWCIVGNGVDKLNTQFTSKEEINAIWKKIILTTDQDLIKDGIQSIDDDFLEWFVKNPSCEMVEVKKGFADGSAYGYDFLSYKIIIPQEDPEPEFCNNCNNDVCCCIIKERRMYSEEEVKQFAFECVTNFLSNSENKVEIGLVDVILDRNNKKFEQFKNKQQ